jgi:hypothetical protein
VSGSIVSSLAHAFCGQAADPLMAFLAYIDAAGDAKDPKTVAVSVGGYIAHESQWAAFERVWTRILDRHGVPALHMKEYAHSARGSCFEKWKGDEAKRAAFMSELIDTIRDHTIEHVVSTIPVSTYDAVNARYLLREAYGGCYAMGLLSAIAFAVKWHRTSEQTEPLIVLIEKGDNEQPDFRRVMARLPAWNVAMVSEPAVVKKKWIDPSGVTRYCVPFQAADFLAYEHAKFFTDLILRQKNIARQSLRAAMRPPKDRTSMLLTAGYLQRLAKGLGISVRFNRPFQGEDVSDLPLEPLCYGDMDRPLISEVRRGSVYAGRKMR